MCKFVRTGKVVGIGALFVLVGCGSPPSAKSKADPSYARPASSADVQDEAPPLYARATASEIGDGQGIFARCSERVGEMENAKLPGEVFSHATDAKQICDEALGKITVIRNNAGLDFRLTDCRQAAWSGSDYADEIIKSFDKSANSDRKEIQRLQHGYSALAESCRNPDVYLLQQAIK